MSESCLLPEFDSSEAAAIAERLFALTGPMKQLNGERDLNFLVTDKRGKFVFKIANAQESAAMLESQHLVFQRLAEAKVFPAVATALESVNGRSIEIVHDAQGNAHSCRVLPFLEGRMWSEFTDFRPELLADLGHKLALLDKALASFSHPGLERPLLWNMKSSLSVLEAYTPLLASDQQRSLVSHFERGYRERVLPLQNDLRRSVIHNDANRGNVLVDASGRQVIGIIDFGDMVDFWLVVEPAIAATYAMLDQADPLLAAQTLLRGYHQTLPLTETEISLVFDLVCMRLCISVCICAHQQKLEPGNEYLVIDLEETWALLDQLQGVAYSEARDGMLAACRQD